MTQKARLSPGHKHRHLFPVTKSRVLFSPPEAFVGDPPVAMLGGGAGGGGGARSRPPRGLRPRADSSSRCDGSTVDLTSQPGTRQALPAPSARRAISEIWRRSLDTIDTPSIPRWFRPRRHRWAVASEVAPSLRASVPASGEATDASPPPTWGVEVLLLEKSPSECSAPQVASHPKLPVAPSKQRLGSVARFLF